MFTRDLHRIDAQIGRFGTTDSERRLFDHHAARFTAAVGVKLQAWLGPRLVNEGDMCHDFFAGRADFVGGVFDADLAQQRRGIHVAPQSEAPDPFFGPTESLAFAGVHGPTADCASVAETFVLGL